MIGVTIQFTNPTLRTPGSNMRPQGPGLDLAPGRGSSPGRTWPLREPLSLCGGCLRASQTGFWESCISSLSGCSGIYP